MPAFGPVASFPVAAIPSGGYYPASGHAIFYGSNVRPNQLQLAAGHLTFQGATPLSVLGPARTTWIGAEVLHAGLASPRVTWEGVEVLRSVATVPTFYQLTWMGVEALHVGVASARATWIGAEILHIGQAAARLTWLGVEVLRSVALMPPDTGFVYLICG